MDMPIEAMGPLAESVGPSSGRIGSYRASEALALCSGGLRRRRPVGDEALGTAENVFVIAREAPSGD